LAVKAGFKIQPQHAESLASRLLSFLTAREITPSPLRGAVAVYTVNQDINRLFRLWDGAQKPGFRFDR